MVLLKIDWLQVTIAAATAGTLFAVVSVALFQAWLERAWLKVRLVRSGVLGEWYHTSPKRARLVFEVEVINRARRENAIQGCAIMATAPTNRTWKRSDLEFKTELFSGDTDITFPLTIPTPGIVRIPIVITLREGDEWFGAGEMRGHVSVLDLHGKHHKVAIKIDRLPAAPIEPTPEPSSPYGG